MNPELIELPPLLRALVSPAEVIDKRVYSPFFEPDLPALLRRRETESLVITGAETNVCVLVPTLPLRQRVRARTQGHQLGEPVDQHARAAKHRIPAHDLAYQPILGRRSGRAD
jgi:hypothetical protein